jgi:hypothetical protein
MSEPGIVAPVPMICLSFRHFLVGILAMTVLNSVVVLLVLSSLPLIVIVVAAVTHPSILKLHFAFLMIITVFVSVAFNVSQIGLWNVRNLFSSTPRRALASLLFLVWQIVIAAFEVDYIALLFVVAVLGVSVRDMLRVK